MNKSSYKENLSYYKDKKLSEADTKAKLIDPLLRESGWIEKYIKREYYITDGKVIKINGENKRDDPNYTDYVLNYNDYPLAVVEAKKNTRSKDAGIYQAKKYAEKIDAQFAYSSNGLGIVEFDFSTNKQKVLNGFPTPKELWERLDLDSSVKNNKSPLTIPYHYDPVKDMKPRYYQEKAINRTIESILSGEKYILLTMATGTGKTYTAFQIIWKLLLANHFKKVLFIADRIVLRNQAYNSFDAFEEGARCIIDKGNAPKYGKIYFSIYQSLYSGEENKLYEEYDSDFFDLVVIDECHRSGFGTWNEILQYFDSAVQLGLTATPKRSDNIDTYEYFGNPVYTYSMKQGIEDGYLATYNIYNIKTNLDADGLDLNELGIDVPEISSEYLTTKDYEKIVKIPDRTNAIIEDFLDRIKNLDNFDVLDKSVIYCVDIEHAREITRLINNKMSYLGIDNFASLIVSDEPTADEELEKFRDVKSTSPVIAVSVDMLTTGFDAPSLKNLVYIKPISSEVVYKQIKGRGSRISEAHGKLSFNIFDYVDCTSQFEDPEFDGIPEFMGEDEIGEIKNKYKKIWSYIIKKSGFEFDELSDEIREDNELKEAVKDYKDIPLEKIKNEMDSDDYIKARNNLQSILGTNENDIEKLVNKIKPSIKKENSQIIKSIYTGLKAANKRKDKRKGKSRKDKKEKIEINNVEVYIKDKKYIVIDEKGRQVQFEDYIDETRKKVRKLVPNKEKLFELYSDPNRREELLDKLDDYFIDRDKLSVALDRFDAEFVDMINHVAFNGILVSREERVKAFKNKYSEYLDHFDDLQKRIIFDLLDKFKIGGVEQIDNPDILTAPPFNNYTKVTEAVEKFGGVENLKSVLKDLEKKLINVA